ncbi:MAG TPA: alpha/beta hydrolase [Aquabacterium sp.]|nr:alpha/beta hydrolase [Aquabacterium sp.]
MNIGLAFFHGWGLDPDFWRPLQAALPDHPHANWNAGYLGSAEQPNFNATTHWVAVGHSLGWATALNQPPQSGWLGTVSLCGFTRFCAHAPGQAGQAIRVLERMVKAFDSQPEQVLSDFLTRCHLDDCLPASGLTLDVNALRRDLQRLIDIDVRLPPAPCMALASRDDPIVSPALTQACFDTQANSQANCQLRWQDEGGHALGHAHADWCAEQIRGFLRGLRHG